MKEASSQARALEMARKKRAEQNDRDLDAALVDYENQKTQVGQSCMSLIALHQTAGPVADVLLCSPRVDGYVAAEQSVADALHSKLLRSWSAVEKSVYGENRERRDELARLHVAYVLTRERQLQRALALSTAQQRRGGKDVEEDEGTVTAGQLHSLKKQLTLLMERIPALIADAVSLRTDRVLLAEREDNLRRLQAAMRVLSHYSSLLRQQQTRQRQVVAALKVRRVDKIPPRLLTTCLHSKSGGT